jgi:hypothetical protein
MENTFEKNIIPDNEEARLRALYRYQLLENLPERYFTNLARIIAQTFNTPIALVSLVDKEQVNFPGNYGMGDTRQVPRGLSLCSLAVLEENQPFLKMQEKTPVCSPTHWLVAALGYAFTPVRRLLPKMAMPLAPSAWWTRSQEPLVSRKNKCSRSLPVR